MCKECQHKRGESMRQLFSLILVTLLMAGCVQKGKEASAPAADEAIQSSPEENNDLSIYQRTMPWKTQNGDEITFHDLKGEVLVVTMIYTSCQSACPRLVEAVKSIESKVSASVPSGVRYVFISIDPEFDTPERLKEYSIKKDMEDPRWLFLQGTEESVLEFANVVAVRYDRISPIEFSHSNIVTVFDQQGVMLHQEEGLNSNYESTVEAVISALSTPTASRTHP